MNRELIHERPRLRHRGWFFVVSFGDLACLDGLLALQSQQMSTCNEQIGQATQHKQAMGVLG